MREEQPMKISDIKPYPRNARHNEAAIPKVAESIREFGLRGTIGLESKTNPIIVFGHTRVAACKYLGWTEIPDEQIEFCDDLTPEQIKAFRIADNKTGDIATYNKSMLREEVRSLKDFDMTRFGIDFKSKHLDYGAERLKTDRSYNLELINAEDCAGTFDMPTLEPCDYVPERLQGFNYAKSTKDYNTGIHFFIDDYQFERLWNRPLEYIPLLKKFDCVLTPDFSLYLDMPLPMQAWNVYRARALGRLWQERGLRVIPALQYSDPRSFGFCFEGLPQNATLATSSVGVKNSKQAQAVWREGMEEALRIAKPKTLILYGGGFEDFDFKDTQVIRMKANTAFNKGENYGK